MVDAAGTPEHEQNTMVALCDHLRLNIQQEVAPSANAIQKRLIGSTCKRGAAQDPLAPGTATW